MYQFLVHGGKPLKGDVTLSGSKNAALPIMAASLLTSESSIIYQVPQLRDVRTMEQILAGLGAEVVHDDHNTLTITPRDESAFEAPYELVKTMRASVCVLGALLARRKRARIALPGGCVIGDRPIDLHLMGLRALGADIQMENGYVSAQANRLKGAHILLASAYGSTVTGTANLMMAAALAQGETVIEYAAREPEIVNLAEFLNRMGGRIEGAGMSTVRIQGVDALRGTEITLIPDRIEAGTFLLAGALTRGEITLKNAVTAHLYALLEKLWQMGYQIDHTDSEIHLAISGRARPIDVMTLPYPGFPTDLQAQMMTLLSTVAGLSTITEKIYPNRFMHISELRRLGAKLRQEGATVFIEGVSELTGAPVMASDLRASAALVLAGLVAQGETRIQRIYHLDRGYEAFDQKLNALGACIQRLPDEG